MDGVLVIKNVSVKLFSFFNGGCIGDQGRVISNSLVPPMEGVLVIKNVSVKLFSSCNRAEYWLPRTCLSNSPDSSMDGVLVIKNVPLKLIQLLQWREYWWSRTCLSNSSSSSMEGVLVIKNVSVKLFSFFNGGSIGDQERVCQMLQLLQWRQYWLSRTCLSNSSASSMMVVLGIKNVSVKLFSSFNGGSIGDQERVCQILQLLQWRQYWLSRTCLSNSSASSMEVILGIKNVSLKLFSSFNGRSIGYQERVCQTLQLHKWRVYWWSRTCLSNSFSSFNGGSIGDQERVCQTLQLLQWREYWLSRTCLSNSSASSMEGVLGIKNVPLKLFSSFNGGSIGDQERVCQTLQLHQWREYWSSRTCLSNSSASSMEGVLVIMNVSVKCFSFFNGGSIGYQERVCQILQLHSIGGSIGDQERDLSNSSAPSMEGVLVFKDVSVKQFGFINGGSIGDEERACQSLQLIYWREYWWSRTDLSNSSVSSTEGLFVTRNVSVKLFCFFNGGRIGNQERVCQTLQLH